MDERTDVPAWRVSTCHTETHLAVSTFILSWREQRNLSRAQALDSRLELHAVMDNGSCTHVLPPEWSDGRYSESNLARVLANEIPAAWVDGRARQMRVPV